MAFTTGFPERVLSIIPSSMHLCSCASNRCLFKLFHEHFRSPEKLVIAHRSWLTRTPMRGQALNLIKLSLLPTVKPPMTWFTVTGPPNSSKAYSGTYNPISERSLSEHKIRRKKSLKYLRSIPQKYFASSMFVKVK